MINFSQLLNLLNFVWPKFNCRKSQLNIEAPILPRKTCTFAICPGQQLLAPLSLRIKRQIEKNAKINFWTLPSSASLLHLQSIVHAWVGRFSLSLALVLVISNTQPQPMVGTRTGSCHIMDPDYTWLHTIRSQWQQTAISIPNGQSIKERSAEKRPHLIDSGIYGGRNSHNRAIIVFVSYF